MSNKKSDFWYYTRGERQATILLLLIAVVIFLLPAFYQSRSQESNLIDHSDFIQAIQQLESQQSKDESPKVAGIFYFDPNTADEKVLTSLGLSGATARTIINYREKIGSFKQVQELQKIYNLTEADYQRLAPYVKISPTRKKTPPARKVGETLVAPFPFNPNTASLIELTRLGISSKTAGILIRYREKGGVFRQKEDLKKIYGLKEQVYQRLEAYIRLPLGEEGQKNVTPDSQASADSAQMTIPASYSAITSVIVDINQATATDWQGLYGIGPTLSGRIVKFRDKLGGFTHIDQVAETYGLPDSTFQAIRTQLKISPVTKMIPINSVTAQDLQAHPYIKWQQAKVIIAYRQQHGPFRNLTDLDKIMALKKEFIQQIEPYIKFD